MSRTVVVAQYIQQRPTTTGNFRVYNHFYVSLLDRLLIVFTTKKMTDSDETGFDDSNRNIGSSAFILIYIFAKATHAVAKFYQSSAASTDFLSHHNVRLCDFFPVNIRTN